MKWLRLESLGSPRVGRYIDELDVQVLCLVEIWISSDDPERSGRGNQYEGANYLYP